MLKITATMPLARSSVGRRHWPRTEARRRWYLGARRSTKIRARAEISLVLSVLTHGCGDANTATDFAAATVQAESPRTGHVEAETAPPCPPGMALIPPEPGAQASVPWFCLDRAEVTVAAWRECVEAGVCLPPSSHAKQRRPEGRTWDEKRDDLPVNYINHTQADAFCRWSGKRLPSVAEWSWAYRSASSKRNVPWGVWKLAPEEESRVLNAMPEGAVCRPAPGAERWTAPCPVATNPGDATKQGVFDMVGNLKEWMSDSDEGPWHGSLPSTGPATLHFLCGDSFRGNFFNLSVAGNCSSLPGGFAREDYGVRCARAPNLELPRFSSFPCPPLFGQQRDKALALLHEYHELLAARAFDRALSWQNERIDPKLFDEMRLAIHFTDEDFIGLWSMGGGMTKRMLEDGRPAPLVPDADIVFTCEDWKYTPLTHDGRPVLRVDDADGQALPFCLRFAATGWVLSCIFPAKSKPSGDPQ